MFQGFEFLNWIFGDFSNMRRYVMLILWFEKCVDFVLVLFETGPMRFGGFGAGNHS